MAAGHSALLYLFTWASGAFGGLLRSCHALEIPFVWNTLDAPGASIFLGELDAGARRLGASMHAAWGSFAGGSSPGGPGWPEWPEWPDYGAGSRATLVLDETVELAGDPQGTERLCWEGVI